MGKEADQFEKKCVFNLDLKDDNDGQFLMSSGMLFQILGTATLKAREPKVVEQKGIFRRCWFVERSMRHPWAVVSSFERYAKLADDN